MAPPLLFFNGAHLGEMPPPYSGTGPARRGGEGGEARREKTRPAPSPLPGGYRRGLLWGFAAFLKKGHLRQEAKSDAVARLGTDAPGPC